MSPRRVASVRIHETCHRRRARIQKTWLVIREDRNWGDFSSIREDQYVGGCVSGETSGVWEGPAR